MPLPDEAPLPDAERLPPDDDWPQPAIPFRSEPLVEPAVPELFCEELPALPDDDPAWREDELVAPDRDEAPVPDPAAPVLPLVAFERPAEDLLAAEERPEPAEPERPFDEPDALPIPREDALREAVFLLEPPREPAIPFEEEAPREPDREAAEPRDDADVRALDFVELPVADRDFEAPFRAPELLLFFFAPPREELEPPAEPFLELEPARPRLALPADLDELPERPEDLDEPRLLDAITTPFDIYPLSESELIVE